MPTSRVKFGSSYALVMHQDGWKVGGSPPKDKSDYLGWHAWAEVQHKAGLRQSECGKCGKWFYPQEFSIIKTTHTLYRSKDLTNLIKVHSPICNGCAGVKK